MGTTPERAPGEAVHHGIQTRIAILVLVAALAPMALLGWASLSGVSELKDTLIGEHRTLVEIASAQVEQGLRATLEALAAVPAGEDPSGRMRNAQRDALRSAQLRSRLLADAFVVDGSGALVASASLRRGGDAFEPSEHPEIAVAIRRGIPSAVRDVHDGSGRIFAVVPLKDATGEPAGAAVGVLDPGSPAWAALMPSRTSGHRLSLRLIGEDGAFVAGSREPVRPADDVVASARLTVLPWTLVLSEPEAQNFSAVTALQRRWAVLAPSLAAVAAVFAWGVARSVKRPLAELDAAAARIAKGDLTQALPALGEDEVGRLGRSFETMRLALARDKLRGELLRRVIAAQEEERKRIARELHDETCQTLTALKIKLEEVGKADSKEARHVRIADAQEMATRSVDELHRVIWDLRPSILDDLGLLPAIRWMAQRHLAPHGIQVRCEFDEPAPRLPFEVEIAVFRAVQEAIANVVRHAEADKVLVEVAARDGALEIDVEDDGRGFDPREVFRPSASGRGLGLLGMRERLELVGGTARVVSSPGAGTRVSLRVPLTHEG